MEILVIVLAIATIISTITDILQVGISWFTLREVGDLDGDRNDWFEGKGWRKYDEGEKIDE